MSLVPTRALLLALFVLAPLPGAAAASRDAPEAASKWSLWSGGTKLRGANLYQRRVYPELDGPDFMGPGPLGPPVTQSDFDALAAMGANWVNLSHPGLFTEKPPYVLDPDVAANLDRLLEMARRANLWAVISARTGPGRSEFTFFRGDPNPWFPESYLNDEVWRDAAAQDGWVAMWRATAARYRGNPVVAAYDLMVEPNAPAVFFEIYEPSDFYPTYAGTLYDWNQLHPRISAAIRQVDTDTPILTGADCFSAARWVPYLATTSDPRTVYSAHLYEPWVYTHQEPPPTLTYPGSFDTDFDGTADTVDRTWLQGLVGTVAGFSAQKGVPVAVNEMGPKRWAPGAGAYFRDLTDLLEERGMNHAFWEWRPAWPPSADDDAFDFRRGPDPANHVPVATSPHLEAVRTAWARNTSRPDAAGSCEAAGTALCLNGSRFRVTATYRDYAGNAGAAQAVPLTNDTGYFWFFGRDNVEVVIKVLDFCAVNQTWAVYAAGLTDVEVALGVTDTATTTSKSYTNPLGTPFVLIRDAPFACP